MEDCYCACWPQQKKELHLVMLWCMMVRQHHGLPEWLRQLEVAVELVPCIVARAHAMTSPCSISQDTLWDCFSPVGFSLAGMVEAQFPHSSIAYMIGKGGCKIQKLEGHFRACIGVHDSTEEEATIFGIGPSTQLEFVLFIIHGLVNAASSILAHLPHLACDVLPP